MKTLFRWAFRLFVLLIVLLVAGILLMDTIARAIIEKGLRQETGLDVRIGRVEVGVWDPRLTIENLLIYNNAEFGGSPMLNLPEVYLESDWGSLRSQSGHLRLLRINCAEINLVSNQTGSNNFGALWVHSGPGNSGAGGRATGRIYAGIDTLNLSLGTVRQLNLKKPEFNREYVLNFKNEIIQGLNSEAEAQQKLSPLLNRFGLSAVSQALFPNAKAPPSPPKAAVAK
jgi:hypothetical protein